MVENAIPVFRSEIGTVEADPQLVRDRLGVGKIFFGGAVLGAVIFLPIFHEQALYSIARLDQHERRHGRVNAA
jgi:hypothetical protein